MMAIDADRRVMGGSSMFFLFERSARRVVGAGMYVFLFVLYVWLRPYWESGVCIEFNRKPDTDSHGRSRMMEGAISFSDPRSKAFCCSKKEDCTGTISKQEQ